MRKTVEIGTPEFKKLEKKNFVKDIENPRFRILADGWIKDLQLNIDWGPSSNYSMNYKNAEEYCESLGGRLPTVDEQWTLIDRSKHDPACDAKVFKDMKNNWYWTSEPCVAWEGARWVVGFSFGYVIGDFEGYVSYARPVRASQC